MANSRPAEKASGERTRDARATGAKPIVLRSSHCSSHPARPTAENLSTDYAILQVADLTCLSKLVQIEAIALNINVRGLARIQVSTRIIYVTVQTIKVASIWQWLPQVVALPVFFEALLATFGIRLNRRELELLA